MNKSELIRAVAEKAELTQADAKLATEAVFEAITEALKKKQEVRLVGFGTFLVQEKSASEGRNPRTGEKLQIPAKHVPKFRPGKELKEAVEV